MMNNNSENLLHSLIIGLLLYCVFRFLMKMEDNSAQSGAIVIACLSCIYLVGVNELKK